jgi:hypothetical protein
MRGESLRFMPFKTGKLLILNARSNMHLPDKSMQTEKMGDANHQEQ